MLTNLLLLLKDAAGNDFFSAVLGFILPVAYSYQPNLTVIAVGPNKNLGISGISLLVALLQGLAESRVLAVIEVRSGAKLWYFKVSGRHWTIDVLTICHNFHFYLGSTAQLSPEMRHLLCVVNHLACLLNHLIIPSNVIESSSLSYS